MNSNLKRNDLTSLLEQVKLWRRHLHMFPEPSFEEHATMEFVCEVLAQNGISFQKGVANTGVVALISAAHHSETKPVWPCVQTSMHSLFKKPMRFLTRVRYRAGCTPVGTMSIQVFY